MFGVIQYLTLLTVLSLGSRLLPITCLVAIISVALGLMTALGNPAEKGFIFFHFFCAAFWRFIDVATGRFVPINWHDRVVHHLTFSGLELGSSRPTAIHINWNAMLQLVLSVSGVFSLSHALSFTTESVLGTSFILAFLCFFAFWAASSACISIFAPLGYELEPFFHDFWNAQTIGQVWKKWNVHFQRVLFYRIHLPLKSKMPKWQSRIVVFSASAAAHWIPHVAFFKGEIRHVFFWNVFFVIQGVALHLEKSYPLPHGLHALVVKVWVVVWSTLLFIPIAHALIQ